MGSPKMRVGIKAGPHHPALQSHPIKLIAHRITSTIKCKMCNRLYQSSDLLISITRRGRRGLGGRRIRVDA